MLSFCFILKKLYPFQDGSILLVLELFTISQCSGAHSLATTGSNHFQIPQIRFSFCTNDAALPRYVVSSCLTLDNGGS